MRAMSDQSERGRLATVWYNLTAEERWNGPILLILFVVLIAAGFIFVGLAS
jgi:hypothetical protein